MAQSFFCVNFLTNRSLIIAQQFYHQQDRHPAKPYVYPQIWLTLNKKNFIVLFVNCNRCGVVVCCGNGFGTQMTRIKNKRIIKNLRYPCHLRSPKIKFSAPSHFAKNGSRPSPKLNRHEGAWAKYFLRDWANLSHPTLCWQVSKFRLRNTRRIDKNTT